MDEKDENEGAGTEETDDPTSEEAIEVEVITDPDPAATPPEEAPTNRRSRVLRLARRIMNTGEIAGDTKELLGSVLGASDRAKTEAVRMAAREVRHYLDELKLKDDLLNLITSYSLEISISLKPLADAVASRGEERDDTNEVLPPEGEPA